MSALPEDLTDRQIEELRTELLRLQRELSEQLDKTGDSSKPVELDQSKVGRLSRMDAMQQQSMAAEERRRRQIRRQQVAAALAAIEEGTYGDCRRCEEPIGYRRLAARPETPFCVPCAGRRERG
jgi:DnaK suppressor protein